MHLKHITLSAIASIALAQAAAIPQGSQVATAHGFCIEAASMLPQPFKIDDMGTLDGLCDTCLTDSQAEGHCLEFDDSDLNPFEHLNSLSKEAKSCYLVAIQPCLKHFRSQLCTAQPELCKTATDVPVDLTSIAESFSKFCEKVPDVCNDIKHIIALEPGIGCTDGEGECEPEDAALPELKFVKDLLNFCEKNPKMCEDFLPLGLILSE